MRLQQLILHNFRPFYGHQTIDLSIDSERPLILIKAFNDVGKTSMFKALQFCLYGTKPREKIESHVNRTAAKEGNGQTYVGLKFYHEDKHYQITRAVDFSKSPRGDVVTGRETLDIRVDGVPQPLETTSEQNKFIEAILPEDASQFFFFDGEDIQKYTKHPPGENVKEAIEMVLGIRELLNARDDIEKIVGELSRELDALLKTRAKQVNAAEEVAALGKEVVDLKNKNEELGVRIQQAQESVEQCDITLRKNLAIKEKIDERNEAEQRRKQITEQIKANKNQQQEFNQHLGALFIAPLLQELSKIRKTSVPRWKRVAISMLLAGIQESCVCGRPIDSEVRELFEESLEKEIDASPVQYLGEKADELVTEAPPGHLENKFYEMIAQLRDLESSLSSENLKISRLSKEIGGRDELGATVKFAEKTRSMASQQIASCEEEKTRKEIELDVKQREYTTKQRKLAVEQSDKDVSNKRQHLEACRMCRNAIEEAISELVANNKQKVEDLASKVFLELTNAPDLYKGIEVTDEYELKILTIGGAARPVWVQAPSAGQSQVIATSFITALNHYTAREAPVIIDTPIGRLDPIHKKNVIRSYPKIGPQVIILYQPSELDDDDIRPIGKYILSEWLLKRDSSNPDATIILRAH